MPLLPVAAKRTSAPLATQRLLHQLHADQLALQRHFDQLSTGRRVLRLSDDPAAAGRALGLQRGIDRTVQLGRNAEATETFYQSADSALARVDEALILARGTAVEAAQNVLPQNEREALAQTIHEALNSVVAAGNAMYRDHQMLGGILESEDAFRWDEDSILFHGNRSIGQTKLGSGVPVPINVDGGQALGVGSTILEGEPLDPALRPDSRLVDLRGGEGVAEGVIRISDGNQWQTLDLRDAATIGDVADVLEATELGGRGLTATISADGFRLEYSDGLPGTLAIADAEGSRMARDLGLDNPQGLIAPPLESTGLAPRATSATRLSDLAGGSGIDVSDGIRIEQGDRTFEIDLSQAETIGDVLIAINRSDADLRGELNETAGRIELRGLRSGVDYSVGENGGDAATQLGIRSATAGVLLSDLGRGQGVSLNSGSEDLIITRPDGVELAIDLEAAETVDDVMQLIRDHPQNQDTLRVLVGLNDVGNGIQLDAPPGGGPLRVRQPAQSDAGLRLGLIPAGETEAEGAANGSLVSIIGDDFRRLDGGGTVDTLLRLEAAVREGDTGEIERLQARLDIDFDRATRTRGAVGTWSRNLSQLREAAASDETRLRDQLSQEVDADFATVLSDMTRRQTALEASLRLIGQTAQMTVLNYL